jgi:opacity protein-like surface antigen
MVMKKSKSALVILGFAAATAVCVQAAAQDSGVYLGGSAGTATGKDSCNGAISLPCNRSGTSWGVHAGYQARFLGLEIGYRNLGKISNQNGGGMNAEVKSKLGEALLVAGLPIERLTVYGKGGIYRAKSTLKSNFVPEGSSTRAGWTLGAGLSYDITRHLAVRLEYQRYNDLGGDAVGFRSDVDVTTLGAIVRF